MIVCGIDPGIALCGCAFLKEEKGKHTLLQAEVCETSKHDPLPKRLGSLYTQIQTLFSVYHPDVVALESLFFNTNAKTALIVGQARGVVLLCAYQAQIPIYEYTPLQVKMSLTGYGRADKSQIQHMTARILHLSSLIKPDDAADAAAIALTHCFSYKMNAHR